MFVIFLTRENSLARTALLVAVRQGFLRQHLNFVPTLVAGHCYKIPMNFRSKTVPNAIVFHFTMLNVKDTGLLSDRMQVYFLNMTHQVDEYCYRLF